MAHWAELDENNVVLRVTVGDNNEPDEGYQWLLDNLGGTWIKTSYNRNIRKNFAGIGYLYDSVRDVFLPPNPYLSWILNEQLDWVAPILRPDSGLWIWNEEELAWEESE